LRQNKDLFAEENPNRVSPEADEARIKRWSFLVDILRAGLEPCLNARSLPQMLVACCRTSGYFIFRAVEIKTSSLYPPSERFAQSAQHEKYQVKSLPLMRTQSIGPVLPRKHMAEIFRWQT
jgi:hypothetical protein